METKLIKNGNAYSLKINGEYVAFVNEDFIGYATQEFRDNLIGVLSLKNCQTIERNYDLDEEMSKIVKTIVPDDRGTDIWYGTSMAVGKQCFQKALELMGNKMYTADNIVDAYMAGHLRGMSTDMGENNIHPICSEHLNSLQQTEWDVEIVMGDPIGIGDKYTPDTKPKLDEDGCLILKRI